MALITEESFQFYPFTGSYIRLSGMGLAYAGLFTPGSNLTVSGLMTFLGTETGTSPEYAYGLDNWVGGSPTQNWLGSVGQTNTSTGWKTVYFPSNISLTSGVPYCVKIIPSGAATTIAYISPQATSVQNTVPNLTDFTDTIDVTTNVYESINSGVMWTVKNFNPVFILINSVNDYYGQPYSSTTIGPYYPGQFSYIGQLIQPKTDIGISGIGTFTKFNSTPEDDLWIELRSGISPFISMGSWKFVGSEIVTTSYTWYTVYGVDNTLASGNNYIIHLKSSGASSTQYVIRDWATANEGSLTGFRKNVSYKIYSYDSGANWTSQPTNDWNFAIYGSYLISAQSFSQWLDETFTMGDGTQKADSIWKADTTQILDYIRNNPSLFKTETVALADSIRKLDSISKSDALAISDSKRKLISKTFIEER